MSLEISRRIRAVLKSDSPTKALPETLHAIDEFVQHQKETELVDLDQVRSDMESMYRELVDHSSPAIVEAFIAILHAFIEVAPPINVITCWWDLVLRAALRDPRLSVKALQQVIAFTLHGLVPNSPKAPEFRKRMVELYLLDAYDENSGRDALEHAAMSADERRIQQFWKGNLGDILEQLCHKIPGEFFDTINLFFLSPQRRLRLSVLLGTILRSPEFRVHEFAGHAILDSLLLSLVVDGSSTLFETEIATLATLLPQLAVHSTETLVRILPFCYAILARVVCWKPRTKPLPAAAVQLEVATSNTSSQSRTSDLELDAADTPKVKSELKWQKLDATFVSSVSDPPSPLPLFKTLYGLYPCNTLEFIKDPVIYLINSGLQCPFDSDWAETIDEDQVRTRSRALLRHHILHSSLIMHTAESELAQANRWAGWDVPRIVSMCTMMDVRDAALSLRPMSDDTSQSHERIHNFLNGLPESPPEHDVSHGGKPSVELQGSYLSEHGRPRVSVQDILATYHALRSGAEIDSIDPSPTWPRILFPSTVPTLLPPTPRRFSPSGSDDSMPPHVEEALAGLQRENLLLRTELNYELWLKRENVKRVGRLYEDRILVKGAEVERQGLHNKLREYKGQVQRLQEALTKEQASASTMKTQHADYTRRLHERLKTEKAEKQKWDKERSRLISDFEDALATLEAQGLRLADATENVFRLETEIKENAPKVQRLRDYEDKINQLTSAQRLWDDDIRRYKEQEAYLEDLRNRYRKKLILIDSYENANRDLEETIVSLQHRVAALESQVAQPRPKEHSPSLFAMIENLRKQVSQLTIERDTLLDNNDKLGTEVEELRSRVETLKGVTPTERLEDTQ